MSKTYHINPETLKPMPCSTTPDKCAYKGQEHYETFAEAKSASEQMGEQQNDVLSTVAKGDDALYTDTPTDFDDKYVDTLQELGKAIGSYDRQVAAAERNRKWLARSVEKGNSEIVLSHYREEAERYESEAAKLASVIEAKRTEIDKFDKIYKERGSWQRAFLVPGGHAHSTQECSTCFPTTKFALLTEYSGKTEDKIVADAGDRACTVCYPSAPVATLNKPSKMLTPDEREAAAARSEREQKRAEKLAKEKAAGIASPDGSPLEGKYGLLKTERAAEMEAVDTYIDRFYFFAQNKNSITDLADMRATFESHPYHRENFPMMGAVVEALAHKRGQSVEEVMEVIDKKARAKFKREAKEAPIDMYEEQ